MADARLMMRDGRVVDGTDAVMRFVLADGGARDALLVAAPAVLLHLHRRRRRRHRRAALGHSERARRVRRRGQGADRRRRADLDQPRLDADAARATIDRAAGRGRRHRAHRNARDADDGAAGGCESKAVAKMVELRAVQPEFPLYGTSSSTGGQPYTHALLQNHGVLVRPELLTALGVEGRRPDHHRPGGVHDSRRDRERAGPAGRRLQPRARAC